MTFGNEQPGPVGKRCITFSFAHLSCRSESELVADCCRPGPPVAQADSNNTFQADWIIVMLSGAALVAVFELPAGDCSFCSDLQRCGRPNKPCSGDDSPLGKRNPWKSEALPGELVPLPRRKLSGGGAKGYCPETWALSGFVASNKR